MTDAWLILGRGQQATRHAILGEWKRCTHPGRPLPHVAMLVGHDVVFGKYSEVNHVWLAWNGKEYTVVYPSHFMELTSNGNG